MYSREDIRFCGNELTLKELVYQNVKDELIQTSLLKEGDFAYIIRPIRLTVQLYDRIKVIEVSEHEFVYREAVSRSTYTMYKETVEEHHHDRRFFTLSERLMEQATPQEELFYTKLAQDHKGFVKAYLNSKNIYDIIWRTDLTHGF